MKFLYVMSIKDRDELLKNNYKLICQIISQDMWVFENPYSEEEMQFASFPDVNYLLSDTLVF